MLWSSSSYGLPIDVRCTTEHICTSDRITRVGYFYMDLCLVHDIQLCYNKSEIRAALRAICDAVVFRTRCRSETDENPIRAAKRCFEPHGTRLPDARISKPHPRKGTAHTGNPLYKEQFELHFKTTSPQGDGTHKGRLPLIFLCFFRAIVTSATESRSILIYTGLIDDSCFQPYRSE